MREWMIGGDWSWVVVVVGGGARQVSTLARSNLQNFLLGSKSEGRRAADAAHKQQLADSSRWLISFAIYLSTSSVAA